jgi:hypothetical protein
MKSASHVASDVKFETGLITLGQNAMFRYARFVTAPSLCQPPCSRKNGQC